MARSRFAVRVGIFPAMLSNNPLDMLPFCIIKPLYYCRRFDLPRNWTVVELYSSASLGVFVHHPRSIKELRMTQAMNLRMFFGVAWLLIGLAWGYWSLSRNKNASLRRSGTFLLLGSLGLIFSFFWK